MMDEARQAGLDALCAVLRQRHPGYDFRAVPPTEGGTMTDTTTEPEPQPDDPSEPEPEPDEPEPDESKDAG